MKKNNWDVLIEPRDGGWQRLSARLARVEESEFQELRVWGMLAVAVMLCLVLVSTLDFSSSHFGSPAKSAKPGEVFIEGAQTTLIEGTPRGVRFYWVQRN